ncbi:carboxypeptidase regulatory-like domain-containing protein [Telmatobacter sp. DSM 110680]|uniref:Carboxypeptidase regulatory-like domain-containing protein n=1 Tax=Telmatobacter sp. DSM 110680 TaxID=3036704 RepID=A0AAU7DHA6_9BACT
MGQAVNGTLLGTVTDSSGATVPGAKVTATEAQTNAVHEAVTNESGNFSFPDLQPGTYSVNAEAKGFKRVTQEKIELLSNSSLRVDLSLMPGNVSETVVVNTAPPELQTDRADISTKIESQDVVDMPLGTNRNFQTLLNLVPGAAPAVFQHSQFFNAASSLQTEANGLPREGNLYQIEGIDDDERTGLLQIIIPPAEAIDSVDISTNNFEAELGRATGAVTNVTLKSGTNLLHGSAFEFIQNNDLNARSYFGGPLGHLSYNYFGGSVGGPILKDRLFIFGDYLRTSDHEQIGSTFTIPDSRYFTPVMGLTGCTDPAGCIDLSAAENGTKGQVYDPNSGDGRTVAQGGTPRTPYPNNQIPFSQVNPVSLAILQQTYAAALKYGTVTTKPLNNPANNYTTNLPFTKTTDSFDIKSDFKLTEKNHISGRYSFQRVITFQQAAFGKFLGGPAGGGFEGTGNQKSYSTGVNFDHVFSPTFLTEARFGVAHLGNSAQPNDYGSTDATSIGIQGVNIAGQPFTSGQAAITINGGFSSPIMGYSASVPWIRAESNIDFVNNWTKIVGNHTFKWGIDVRRIHDDLLQDQTFSPRGAFTFSDVQTSDASSPGTTVANDIASFLLDQPSQTGRDLNTFFPRYRQWWTFAFASDKWQATPKLTLDLGLRWEFYPPATPVVKGGFSNYNPANDTLVLAGLGSNPSNLGMQTRYKYFAPRTGFAYRVSPNTVVRGGFGISYTPFPDNTYAYNYPVRANNSYQPVGASGFTPAVLGDGVTVATFQAGFPAPVPVTIPSNGIIALPTSGTSLLAKQLIAQVYTYIPLTYKNPYADSWNVALQQALPYDLSFQLAYVANHGTDISGAQNINLPSYYGGGAASDPENHDANGNLTFGRTAATNEYFLGFSSNYESLQAQLTKRASHDLTFTSAFTWGKALGYISGDDGGLTFFINWRRNYAPLDFDRTLNFEQSFTYGLPFGRGHQLATSTLADAIVGGWRLSGIVSVVSGMPFTVTANGASLNTPGTTQTATLVKPFHKTGKIGASTPWFDPTSFAQPSGCTSTPCNPGLGNTGRNQFRGPGYLQDNLSIFKRFTIYRESALEVRVDAFQLSNTPQFAQPNGSGVTAASFGTITGTLGSGQGSVNGVGGGRTLQGSAKISF